MRQLVELGKNKAAFAEAGADVIAVFREERQKEAGLNKIKAKTKTSFNLALDNGNKQTSRYSPGRREFSGYVINSSGVITDIFQGDLRNRAKSAQLIAAVKAASAASAEGSDSKESDSTEAKAEAKPEPAEAKGSTSKEADTSGSAKKSSEGSSKK